MSLDTARKVLEIEADAVRRMAERVDARTEKAVQYLYTCRGRVVVTGMGKSGLVAQKISATLSSTGTPSFFLHPAEAIHGDLGNLVRGDVLIALSYSGETVEILRLLDRVAEIFFATRPDFPSCWTLLIPYSFRALPDRQAAASRNSSNRWHAPAWQPVWTAFFWRSTTTPQRLSPTGPTRFPLNSSAGYSNASLSSPSLSAAGEAIGKVAQYPQSAERGGNVGLPGSSLSPPPSRGSSGLYWLERDYLHFGGQRKAALSGLGQKPDTRY